MLAYGVFQMPHTPPTQVAKWEISQLSCGISYLSRLVLVGGQEPKGHDSEGEDPNSDENLGK